MPRKAATSGRILIVDDDERQHTALAAMLSDDHFETQSAADGQEALERLTTLPQGILVSGKARGAACIQDPSGARDSLQASSAEHG